MKNIVSIVMIPLMLVMASCSSLPSNVQNVINDPRVQAILQQIEQTALQLAIDFITSHLGAKRMGSSENEAGVQKVKVQLMEKFQINGDLAEMEARAAFAKAAKR